MDKHQRAATQKADRYARNKAYTCLVPGCTKPAIQSHSVPRASIAEALADNGVVYGLRQSFNPVMTMDSPADPMDVAEVGINAAGTFRGFCAEHDSAVFAAAERTPLKASMCFSLQLRALSLEYCRKRRTVDFFRKLSELTRNEKAAQLYARVATETEAVNELFKKLYIGSVFAGVDSVEYFVIPLARNLQVSCCGCFQQTEEFDSVIAYNVISYADSSFIALTTFKVTERCLDAFLVDYEFPTQVESMVNELAFSKGEEPLISPRLWRSLTEEQRVAVQLSLRPPHLRGEAATPKIVTVAANDLVGDLTAPFNRRISLIMRRSLDDAEETIRLDPDNVNGLINRGTIRAASGDQAGALEDFSKVIGLQPLNPLGYLSRAAIRQGGGDLDGALADYDEAANLNPSDPRIFWRRGLVRRTKGDVDGSLADFTRVIDLQPTRADAYVNRGALRGEKGDMVAALEDCNNAIRLDPNLAVAFMNRGHVRKAMGEIHGALQDYDRALELNPDFADVFLSRSLLRVPHAEILMVPRQI